MAILEVEHIRKSFGRTEVLKDISFMLDRGRVVSIIGSSGSGKTTLLRCLNFLETPDAGVIRVNGDVLFDGDKPETLREDRIRSKRLHFRISTCSRSIRLWKISCWRRPFSRRTKRAGRI